jgi:DNA topoisomerase I
LPRTLGELDGEPVTVQNGRYGPYVKRGSESRSLDSEEQMFTVTMDEAKALLAQPKPRGRAARAAAAPPLRELGEDSASGKPIVLREGRFGPYVTDGETNASLRKSDTVESITPQRAVELLAERRAAAPAPKRKPGTRSTKTAASKAAASKTTPTKTASTRKNAAEPKAAAAKSGARPRATKKAVAEDGHDS